MRDDSACRPVSWGYISGIGSLSLQAESRLMRHSGHVKSQGLQDLPARAVSWGYATFSLVTGLRESREAPICWDDSAGRQVSGRPRV